MDAPSGTEAPATGKRTRVTCVALGALVVGVVWPSRARWLTTWDSVMFALAMEDYDVSALRPHAPGYPVYIALARAFRTIMPDDNAALILLSVVATAGAVIALYLLGRRLFDEWTGLSAALLLALTPVTVWNGRIATSYPFDAFWSVTLAGLAWWAMCNPTRKRVAALALAFAVALGFRQSLLFFLGPLVAFAVIADRPSWRAALARVAVAAAVAVPVATAWFLPMASESGGIEAWRRANALQSTDVVFRHTVYNGGLAAWQDLWPRFVLYLRSEIRFLLPVVVAALAALAWIGRRRHVAFALPQRKSLFLAVWALPALVFYLSVFNGWDRGPTGYILVVLPVISLVGVAITMTAARAVATIWGKPAGAAFAVVLLAVPVAGYISFHDQPVDFDIEQHDAWAAAWAEMPTRFPAHNTTILASHSWAHVWYYFPDYVSYGYTPIPEGMRGPAWNMLIESQDRQAERDWYDIIWNGPDDATHALPPDTQNVVVFDFQMAGENDGTRVLRDDIHVQETRLVNGWRVLYFEVADGLVIEDVFSVPVNRYP